MFEASWQQELLKCEDCRLQLVNVYSKERDRLTYFKLRIGVDTQISKKISMVVSRLPQGEIAHREGRPHYIYVGVGVVIY